MRLDNTQNFSGFGHLVPEYQPRPEELGGYGLGPIEETMVALLLLPWIMFGLGILMEVVLPWLMSK